MLIDGQDAGALQPHELRRRIGYVFQRVGLFPHMTVGENVGVTLTLLGWDRRRTAARVEELLELVELDPALVRERHPDELSGGEQQRVGVARALAASPRLMLLDEPFGALDPLTRDRLQQSFLRIRQRLGLTAIFVTHDMVEALLIGDRIAVMHGGVWYRSAHLGPVAVTCGRLRQLMSTLRRRSWSRDCSRTESSERTTRSAAGLPHRTCSSRCLPCWRAPP